MKKITSLTEEQKARFPEFIKKWTDIGLSTEPANRLEAEDGIRQMYSIAGLKEPKIVWCDSPFSQGLTRMIIQKMEKDGIIKKIGASVGASVVASVGASVGASVRNSVGDSVWASVRNSVRNSVGASVWASVGASVGDSVRNSVRNSVGDSVGNSVRASVWASVRNSVRNSVGDSVGDSVWASVGDSVWDSVGNSVWDSVRNSVRNSVGDSVGDSVWASVGNSVRASVWDSGYGQHDANWLAFYDFFSEVTGLKKETDKLNGIWKVSKNAGWYLPHENICWISERHSVLHRNDTGQLHNVRGMALMYPDGWGIYALNGVRFTEDEHTRITSETMTLDEVLKEFVDADKRTQAMRFVKDKENAIANMGGIALDTHTKYDIFGEPVNYTLYEFKKGDLFSVDAYYCLMDCPSTGKKHFEGVFDIGKPGKTVAEAMAWSMSNDFVTVTPEQWASMTPLLDEN